MLRIISLLIFLSVTSSAQTLEEFGRQMSFFYKAPSKEAFLKFQNNADKHQKAFKSTKNGADILVALMIARISEENDWPIISKSFGEKAKEILEGNSKLAKYINDPARVDPGKLDMWWASYFATGNEIYLEKIFTYVGENPKEAPSRLIMVYGAASWSFKANCRQHKSVYDFAQNKLNKNKFHSYKTNFLKSCLEEKK